MVEIKQLTDFNAEDLQRIAPSYTSQQKYVVTKTETYEQTQITLNLISLEKPYIKRFLRGGWLDTHYAELTQTGFCVGAFDNERVIGMSIAEEQDWNRTLIVWEFHIDMAYRGQGIGRRMMDAQAEVARKQNMRVIELETANTNVPAILFYRKVGFSIEKIDLSYYTDDDVTDGDVAIFMKKRLTANR
ncbi:MAG: GNAT family N-acetyltransferase [Chitinophagaceae bacterium]|nr:GNAT family N-acetyltransferase [Anaerolineae bacterium]